MTLEEHLKKLREIDVRDIDPSTLVDIKDVHIDTSLPVEQRLASVLQQMNGNPSIPLFTICSTTWNSGWITPRNIHPSRRRLTCPD